MSNHVRQDPIRLKPGNFSINSVTRLDAHLAGQNVIEKDLICIVCPNGCRLHGTLTAEGELEVTGNRCVRGKTFAGSELTNPTRSITTTVKTVFEDFPYLPVRTDGEIPKYAIPAVLDDLQKLTITKRTACGDVVFEDVGGTGINVIATMTF